MDPLVSVLLCTYDQKQYLAQAVESALAQTYPATEVIVIDNGSRDGSAELLRPYAEGGRIRLLAHATNAPLTQRLNEAVRVARGEYVSLLFGDDYYLPEKLARQVAEFARLEPEYGVVYSPNYRLDMRSGALRDWPTITASGDVLEAMLASHGRAAINPIAPLIRRECLEAFPFDEQVRLIADSVFYFIALSYRFQYLAVPLTVMRDHEANSGWAYRRNFEDGVVVFDHLRRHPLFPQRLGRKLVTINASQARDLAWKMLRYDRDAAEARSYLLRAVRWDAGQLLRPRYWAALSLSLVPSPVRRGLNATARAIKRGPRLAYRDDYA